MVQKLQMLRNSGENLQFNYLEVKILFPDVGHDGKISEDSKKESLEGKAAVLDSTCALK